MHATSFIIGENSTTMRGWRKIVFMKAHLYFLSLKHFRLFVFTKDCYKVGFFGNIFTKPEFTNENSQPCMTGDYPLGKFVCLLKQWGISELQTHFSPWIFFMTKMIFYKKKLKIPLRESDSEAFLSSRYGWLTKLNGLFCACCYFCIAIV